MVEATPSSVPRSHPWVLTIFGFFTIVGLGFMPFVAGDLIGDETPDIVRFIGHFHPLVLHLPIGVFILILLQELGSIFFTRSRVADSDALFPLCFGSASAIVAAQHAEQRRHAAEAGTVADAGGHGNHRHADHAGHHGRQRAFHAGDDNDDAG